MFYYLITPFCLPQPETWSLQPFQQLSKNADLKNQEKQTNSKNFFSPTIIYNPFEPELAKIPCDELQVKSQRPLPEEKHHQKDEEYRPKVYTSKKSKKSQQLQNRNVVPNIIRLIISFIQKKGKSQKIVEQLLIRQGINQGWSAKRFYFYQSLVRTKINNYVNQQTLTQLCMLHPQEYEVYSRKEQEFYNKVTRVIISHFLSQEIVNCILTSKRMDRNKKFQHLRALRSIKLKLAHLVHI